MSCLTVTLNPAIDTTYDVKDFQAGTIHRVASCHRRAGGKGNNVARVLATLGHKVTATGFLAGSNGSFIENDLQAGGIRTDFAWLPKGDSRTCLAIVDEITGTATEILESGPEVTTADVGALIDIATHLASRVDVVVISGSAPPGMSRPELIRLGQALRSSTGYLIVDSSGDSLIALLESHPDVIKPNRAELESLIDQDPTDQAPVRAESLSPVYERLAPGGRMLISLGSKGAVLFDGKRLLRGWLPPMSIVNSVGCGDAMVAGFVAAYLHSEGDKERLRTAIAAAAAAALEPFAGQISPSTMAQLRPNVTVGLVTNDSIWSPLT